MSALETVHLKKKTFQVLYFCPLDQMFLHSVPIILISANKGLLIIRFFTYRFSSIASNQCSCLIFRSSRDLSAWSFIFLD